MSMHLADWFVKSILPLYWSIFQRLSLAGTNWIVLNFSFYETGSITLYIEMDCNIYSVLKEKEMCTVCSIYDE